MFLIRNKINENKCMFLVSLQNVLVLYVINQPLCHGQDVTQGQFLSRVKLICQVI